MYQPRPDATVSERLAVIEEMVWEMKDTLLGNGQPGKLAEFERRVARLEHWRSGLGGIMMFIGGLTTVGGAVAAVIALVGMFKK